MYEQHINMVEMATKRSSCEVNLDPNKKALYYEELDFVFYGIPSDVC